eukprot:2282466-Pyramimonas_sp.AAC.1
MFDEIVCPCACSPRRGAALQREEHAILPDSALQLACPTCMPAAGRWPTSPYSTACVPQVHAAAGMAA